MQLKSEKKQKIEKRDQFEPKQFKKSSCELDNKLENILHQLNEKQNGISRDKELYLLELYQIDQDHYQFLIKRALYQREQKHLKTILVV